MTVLQREAGERCVGRILTLTATCRQHGRSLFTYFAAARASARGGAARGRQPRLTPYVKG